MRYKDIPYEDRLKIHDEYDKYTRHELCCMYGISRSLLKTIKEEIDNEKSKNRKGNW